MTEMRHEELAELLAVYALDALDGDERAIVEEHLPLCARCRAELAEHREVAALLAHTGSPAPEGVWDRLASVLEDEQPPDVPLAKVLSIDSRRRTLALRTAMVLGAAAVLMIALLGLAVWRQERDIDDLRAESREPAIDQAVQAALVDPDNTQVVLASADGRLRGQVVIGSDGQAFLFADNLPALSKDRTYQLWGTGGRAPVSLGVLGPDPGTVTFRLHGRVRGLAVTSEAAPGVVQPEHPALVTGTVS